ncbi:mono/diheme cytochrome c family protein [Pedobacter sp. AK013]|uniref:multiheme c-type cytochrome n=1 Tax=Pedobacter sp. AK013 TaxID=2723071 RepID=UPI00161A219A|nr:multiheme c-type cytochrome [Pedobacter sp. AK013]MBB6238479.1 mono/diheme cytochrome c family protein [Pedobacter sp. AK013]
MKGIKRILVILGAMVIVIIILSRCMNVADQLPKDIRGETYTGAATCVKCHKETGQSFIHNAHGLTSKPIVGQQFLQVFTPDSNVFNYDVHQKVVIEKRAGGIFQIAYVDGKEVRAEKFDMVFGSGEKAYTYAYWKGKKLYELPLSYFSAIRNWAISPGFPKQTFYYDRLIGSRCLECHASYVDKKITQTSGVSTDEELERGALIYGIDCERCHGPGRQHAVFHLENPEVKTAKFIAIYKTLSRKQKMDACGVCHSGNALVAQKSVFGFQPGDNLDDYYAQDFAGFGGADPDVHGNQTEMLKGSNCYRKSETMTCQSCHNTHENIKGNLNLYSQRCINCHQSANHSKTTLAKGSLSTNCIDCHMPKESSKLITFQQAGKADLSAYLLRSHHIGIYPVNSK